MLLVTRSRQLEEESGTQVEADREGGGNGGFKTAASIQKATGKAFLIHNT